MEFYSIMWRTLVCLWVHIRENSGLHNTDSFKSVSPKILVLNCLNRCNFKVDIIPSMCFRGGDNQREQPFLLKKRTLILANRCSFPKGVCIVMNGKLLKIGGFWGGVRVHNMNRKPNVLFKGFLKFSISKFL